MLERFLEEEVVPVLVPKQIALLGMKSMGDKNILKGNTVTPLQCLQSALSRPTADGKYEPFIPCFPPDNSSDAHRQAQTGDCGTCGRASMRRSL